MKFRILIILIIIFLSTGVSNYKELDELAIVTAISIDKAENDEYLIAVQVMNSKKTNSGSESSGSSSQITVFESKDKTIQGALRNMVCESPKKLYLSHLQFLIVSEEVAKEGLNDKLNYFIRNSNINHEVVILLAKNDSKAKDVISVLTPVEMNPTNNLHDSLESAYKYLGDTSYNTISVVLDDIMKDYKEAVVGMVEIKGNKEEASKADNIENAIVENTLVISGIGFFNKDKLEGSFSSDDAKMYNILVNKLKNTIIQTEIDDIKLAYNIESSKCKIKVKKDGESFNVNITLDIDASLTELESKISVNEKVELSSLEKALEDKLENMLKTYIYNTVNVYKLDITGFGDLIYKKYGEKFEVASSDYLSKLKFEIGVKANLKKEGSVLSQW